MNLQAADQATVATAAPVYGDLFATLGVQPRLGRGFDSSREGTDPAIAVLSDTLWHKLFQADPGVVGRLLSVDGIAHRIVGVMPPGFGFPHMTADLWVPLEAPKETGMMAQQARAEADLGIVARLRPGVSVAQAQADLSGIQSSIAQQYGKLDLASGVTSMRLHDARVASVRPTLLAIAGLVGLVWLIACAAAAGLLLTRLAARRRELAVRTALGAGRTRLALQLLGECALAGCTACLLGAALACGIIAGLGRFLVSRLPNGMAVHADGRVLLGLLTLSLLSVCLACALPVWLAARPPATWRSGSLTTADRSQTRLRDLLVIAEVAVALALLTGAGLLLRTLHDLRRIPLGFATDHILTATLEIPPLAFAHRDVHNALDQPLLARLRALPGVQAAALTTSLPLDPEMAIAMHVYGKGKPRTLHLAWVSPGYLSVFRTPLLRGRFFDAALDTPGSVQEVVINQAAAREFYPRQNPVDQYLLGGRNYRIIGELSDAHSAGPTVPDAPMILFSTSQLKLKGNMYNAAAMFRQVALRSSLPPAELSAGLRSALHEVAPEVAVGKVETMNELVAQSMGDQIFAARLLVLFALATCAIALFGLYAVLAYTVAQRTREIGVRMALGAAQGQIAILVLRRAAILISLGIGAGMAMALASSRILAAWLYGVPPRDPLTLAAAALALLLAGGAAAWWPARRAASVSPLIALRSE